MRTLKAVRRSRPVTWWTHARNRLVTTSQGWATRSTPGSPDSLQTPGSPVRPPRPAMVSIRHGVRDTGDNGVNFIDGRMRVQCRKCGVRHKKWNVTGERVSGGDVRVRGCYHNDNITHQDRIVPSSLRWPHKGALRASLASQGTLECSLSSPYQALPCLCLSLHSRNSCFFHPGPRWGFGLSSQQLVEALIEFCAVPSPCLYHNPPMIHHLTMI